MASTIEVFLAGLALMITTVVVFIMIFVNAMFWGPFVKVLDQLNAVIGGPLKLDEFSYIFPFIFTVIVIMWIISIIAFVIVIGRRTVYDDIQ
jgi:cellobiose-specific phosphotransferase system component IIC